MTYALVIVLFCVCSHAFASPSFRQDYGLCSQVFLMHQYCTSQVNPTSVGAIPRTAVHPRVGMTDRRGLRGQPGINYTAIEERISTKYADLEGRIDEKFERLERKINAELVKGNAQIEKLRNDTARDPERIERNWEDIEASIGENFKQLEEKVNAELENAEIEKVLNATIRNPEKYEGSWEEIYDSLVTSCNFATKSKIRSWDGKGGITAVVRKKMYCDITTDGGGWTVFQRRKHGSVDFYRTWEEYVEGFGDSSGEFWLGLEQIHQLTQNGAYELRVELTDWNGTTAYAQYGQFSIAGRSKRYQLTLGEYNGTAGDSMSYYSWLKLKFTTKDLDFDNSRGNCAVKHGGAWWYAGCGYSSLNGRYNDTSSQRSGLHWYRWGERDNYSLKGSEMKFRKKRETSMNSHNP